MGESEECVEFVWIRAVEIVKPLVKYEDTVKVGTWWWRNDVG